MNSLIFKPTRLLGSWLLFFVAMCLSTMSHAGMISVNTWLDTSTPTAGYQYTINDNTAGRFTFSISVNPFDADIFAVAFNTNGSAEYDLSNIDIQNFTAVPRAGSDVTSTPNSFFNTASCDTGCNFNGLPASVIPLDVILKIGSSGSPLTDWFYDVTFDIADLGLSLTDFTHVAIRGQSVLGGNSDKAYQVVTVSVNEPKMWVFLLLASLTFAWPRVTKVKTNLTVKV